MNPMPKILRHLGKPVPYITRWSLEVAAPAPQIVPWLTREGVRVEYGDERPTDRHDGVLWLREFDLPGKGTPAFKDIHSGRQRRCMVEGLCQVCGEPIDKPIPWMIPTALRTTTATKAGLLTDVAPICHSCLPQAEIYCPHLREHGFQLFDVYDYRLKSVFGDVIDVPGKRTVAHPLQLPKGAKIFHYQADRPIEGYLGNVVARQMVVELWNFRRRRT
jgi:hypothetical protein